MLHPRCHAICVICLHDTTPLSTLKQLSTVLVARCLRRHNITYRVEMCFTARHTLALALACLLFVETRYSSLLFLIRQVA